MRRLIALTIALALIIGIPVYTLADGPHKNASELCKDLDDFGGSHGECVSILQNCFNLGNTNPVCLCKFWEHLLPQNFYENFSSIDVCVSILRAANAD